MNKLFLTTILLTGFCDPTHSQEPLAPPNGGDGIPGPLDKSFSIHWAPYPNAIAYEYVMSDNPLCFAGCPGDTRQKIVSDTTALEYNLQVDVWYYWILRVIKSEGDTTNWANISSFLALEQKSRGKSFFQLGPNPTAENKLNITINWENNLEAQFVDIQLFDPKGTAIYASRLNKEGYFKFNEYEIDLRSSQSGLLILVAQVDGNPNNPNNRIINKVIFK